MHIVEDLLVIFFSRNFSNNHSLYTAFRNKNNKKARDKLIHDNDSHLIVVTECLVDLLSRTIYFQNRNLIQRSRKKARLGEINF